MSVNPDQLDFQKGNGLIPAVVQDADTLQGSRRLGLALRHDGRDAECEDSNEGKCRAHGLSPARP